MREAEVALRRLEVEAANALMLVMDAATDDDWAHGYRSCANYIMKTINEELSKLKEDKHETGNI